MADGEMPFRSVPSAEIKHFVCDLHQRLERPEGCPNLLYKVSIIRSLPFFTAQRCPSTDTDNNG